jgi:ABC-2 type transport system permease protein
MKILVIATKDLRQIVRDRKSAIFLLALPVLFTLLMGAIFSSNQGDPRLPVGLVSMDSDPAVEYLRTLLGTSETVRPVSLAPAAAADPGRALREGGLAAVVIVPAGFDAAAMQGETPVLNVERKDSSLAGTTADRAIQLAATRLLGAYQVARLSAPFAGSAAGKGDLRAAVGLGVKLWGEPRAAFLTTFAGLEPGANPALIQNGYLQASTGMMVFFMLVGTISPGAVLLSERRGRTLARMRTIDLAPMEVLIGHLLAMFAICFAQIILLSLFGQWAVGVGYWKDPAGMVALAAGMAFFTAAVGLSLGMWARSENQVMLAAMGGAFGLGILGGCFFSLELVDRSFALVGRWLPSAWAIDALRQLALHGAGEADIARPLGLLAAAAVGVLGVAVWRFAHDPAEMD